MQEPVDPTVPTIHTHTHLQTVEEPVDPGQDPHLHAACACESEILRVYCQQILRVCVVDRYCVCVFMCCGQILCVYSEQIFRVCVADRYCCVLWTDIVCVRVCVVDRYCVCACVLWMEGCVL
jgi:hypothetical protein